MINLYQELGAEHFIRKPVPVREFMHSKDYLGRACSSIYPRLIEDLEAIFEGSYSEVIFTGSPRTGKSTVVGLAMLYIIYILSCLKDPSSSFDLEDDSIIHLSIISDTIGTARSLIFGFLLASLKDARWFKDNLSMTATPDHLLLQDKKNPKIRVDINVQSGDADDYIAPRPMIASWMHNPEFMGEMLCKPKPGPSFIDSDPRRIYQKIKGRPENGTPWDLMRTDFLSGSRSTSRSFMKDRIRKSASNPRLFVRDYTARGSFKRIPKSNIKIDIKDKANNHAL